MQKRDRKKQVGLHDLEKYTCLLAYITQVPKHFFSCCSAGAASIDLGVTFCFLFLCLGARARNRRRPTATSHMVEIVWEFASGFIEEMRREQAARGVMDAHV